MMALTDALQVVDDDLPDGVWMALLGELTGMDASEVADELARLSDNGAKALAGGEFVAPKSDRSPPPTSPPPVCPLCDRAHIKGARWPRHVFKPKSAPPPRRRT